MKKNFLDRRTEGEGIVIKGRTQHTYFNRRRFNARLKSRGMKQNCYECGEQGHLKRDCPRLKEKRGNQKLITQQIYNYLENIVDNGNSSDDNNFVGEVFAVSSDHKKNS